MTELLRAEGLSAFYVASRIVFDIDLALPEKSTLALLGRNGAGKGTTMKALAGIVPAGRGRIFFAGHDITCPPPHARAGSASPMSPRTGRCFRSTALKTIS